MTRRASLPELLAAGLHQTQADGRPGVWFGRIQVTAGDGLVVLRTAPA